MGFRVRKSFKVAPGVKLNVGKKSMGVSIGGRGASYSINTRTGARTTVGLPGTGLSYSTTSKKYNSSAYTRNNELRRLQKEQDKLQELERNQLEVELFENKIDMIKSIHKEADSPVDWSEVEKRKMPFDLEHGEKGSKELQAIKNLNGYKPSFMDKVLKKADEKIAKLKEEIEIAKEKEKQEYENWKTTVEAAKEIQKGNTDMYLKAIEDLRPLDDLLEFGSGFEFLVEDPTWLEVDFYVNSDMVVPKEVKGLTKTGKVSTKKMTKTMYYDIEQDYVCSCTLRIARDMFALLPIEYIVINALDKRINTATGIYEEEVILSTKINKANLERLNMELIDPSDSMINFETNMSFKKTGGLSRVQRILSK
ncbi:MAG: DUF4236 domain-containing protein [Clostridium chrysemydis]|uniref:DUF4236 domain-containing protein n=1 Tax=Clostridium chrysemydis TaxID=2665504 RepID=UPI003F344F66